MLIKEYTFLVFLCLMVVFIIFIYYKVPETKNKTFEEIASQFQPGDELEVEEVTDDDVFHPTTVTTQTQEAVKLQTSREEETAAVDSESGSACGLMNQTFWSIHL
jgi:preprotein translocase subunit YajC